MPPLSSKERMLAVLRRQEPDHVPLILNAFGFKPWWTTRPLNSQVDMAEAFLELGLDAWLNVDIPLAFHPAVTVRQRTETIAGEQWPCMVKEYQTPAGVLKQEVYLTDDWVSDQWPGHKGGEPTVNLFDDYNVPRYRRCPIQNQQDLEKLKYLYPEASPESIGEFRRLAKDLSREAGRLGVLLRSNMSEGTDAAMRLCGPQNLLDMALDQPELFDGLLGVLHAREKHSAHVLQDSPVDLVVRRGYYEGTTFWSPSLYRRFFMPRIKELTDLAHEGGKFMGYTMSVGYMPLLEIFAEVGYDAHYLLDPVPSGGQRADLAKVKAVLGGKIAVIGGLNEPVTLEHGSAEDIRQEVFAAVRTLGEGGGLALSPAEAVFNFTPRKSMETLFEAWRQVRDYPLCV